MNQAQVKNAVASLFKENVDAMVEIIKDLKEANKLKEGAFPATLPVFVPALTPDEFYVYTNIVINPHETKIPAMIQPTLDTAAAELADERKAVKWADPVKTVQRRDTLSIAKFLIKYFNLKDHGYKDNEIRDMAQLMAAKYMMLPMVFCTTPFDYVTMYKVQCGSCMVLDTVHGGDLRNRVLDIENVWPSVLLNYSPQWQGVYLMKGESIVARTSLYRKDSLEPFREFARARGSTPAFADMLEKQLTKFNYVPKADYTTMRFSEEFEVPPLLFEDKYYCPIPHVDEMAKPFQVAWDEERKVFLVGPTSNTKLPKASVTSTYTYSGWLEASKLK